MDANVKEKFTEGVVRYAEFLEKDMKNIINDFSYKLNSEKDTIEFSFSNNRRSWFIHPSEMARISKNFPV